MAGDLNTEPGDLAYRILVTTSGLQDFYDSARLAGTNKCTKNSYSTEAERTPTGKRIDYILIRPSDNIKIKSIDYCQPLPERVPHHDFSYSDHEAVEAKIQIIPVASVEDERKVRDMRESQTEDNKVALSKCIEICDQSLKQLGSHRKSYAMIAVAIVVLLLNLIELQAPYGLKTLFLIVKLCMAAAAVFLIFMATIWNVMERHAVLSGKLSMEILLMSIEKIGGDN